MGPRQEGKSTVVRQVLKDMTLPYLFFSADISNYDRFQQYIQAAIIDATINKDILMDSPIGKPALLRQTFELGASYSGELLSLTKMVGSLQDADNTTTLTGYINLLNDSGLLCGLQKFSIDTARRRASVPKFQVYCNALKMIFSSSTLEQAIMDSNSTTPQPPSLLAMEELV